MAAITAAMHRAWLLSLALVGCAAAPDPVHYTGETRRFVVDSISVPKNSSEARMFGADLDGDRSIDNQLGLVLGNLASFGNVTSHGSDMIAAGVIASSVELIADDFSNDDSVALHYIGADGEPTELVGGALADGTFEANRSGSATLHLPVFVDADPVLVRMSHVRATLVPDGRGGFDATITGTIEANEASGAAAIGIAQMLASRPGDHITLFRMVDHAPTDFVVTPHEIATSPILVSLLSPDVMDGDTGMLTFGLRVHISPCAEGRCTNPAPAATCFDRVRNGSETDIDCGGSCTTCTTAAACSSAADCESAACDGGSCAAPSCENGVRDGLETDVDCGSQCGGCAVGKVCWSNNDCASLTCGAPCDDDDIFCGPFGPDTCRS